MAVTKSLMAKLACGRGPDGFEQTKRARKQISSANLARLDKELEQANERIEQLEREIRDRSVSGNEVPPLPPELLAQGDDVYE